MKSVFRVFRFAQIVHHSGAKVAPILFTWPSRATLFDYKYDRESTNYSRTAFELTLKTLARDPNVKDITVLAHSMGTWLAMESLRQMAIRDGRVDPKINNAILASPDIDVDVFARQFTEMGQVHPKFTIFVSPDDRVLAASRMISGDVLRLGAINPAVEP
jgi:esterase/lipase superfamily enzyme